MKQTRFAATAYIIYENKVLLIKHPKIKKWLPVGGKVDAGESPDQAVLREIKEEVGLDVEIINKKDVLSNKVCSYRYAQLEDLGDKYHFDFIYYTKTKTDILKFNAEINEAKWIDYIEFLEIKADLFDDIQKELEIIFLQVMSYNPYMLINHNNTEKLCKQDFEIVVINHCDMKTEQFIKTLKSLFNCKIYFICKKYSYDEKIAKTISNLTENKDFFNIDMIIRDLNKHDKKIMVFDLSGIFYNISEQISNNKRISLIEDTKNGHNNNNIKKLSRLSIATSNLKKLIENPLVAKGVFDAYMTYYRDHGYEVGLTKKVLVIGVGSIGSYLMKLLETRFNYVCGYDTDILVSSKMLLNHHKMLKNLDDISKFDIIFGVTGESDALNLTHLKILKNNVHLINCSTDSAEFSQDKIAKYKIDSVGFTKRIKLENTILNLLNSGHPINFYKHTGTDKKVIDTIFAYMIDSIVEWILNSKQKDLCDYSTDDVMNKDTSEKYIKYFYNSYME